MTAIISDELRKKIASVRIFVTDVDGVLTDGGIIMDHRGDELKQFNVRDGHGLKLLIRYGIAVAFLTGRESPVVSRRARDLGIEEVYQGVKDKGSFMADYLGRKELAPSEVAYAGDDIVDIPVFRQVGFAVAVADACREVREAADYVAGEKGGRGAIRETCELILKVQNKWPDVMRRYGIE